jgi:uncharacterized OB-fold protein
MTTLPPPIPDEDSQPFWDYCKAGELRAQRCSLCATLRYPPRPICAECGSFDFEWQRLSGRGEIYSYTVTRQAIHPALEGVVPHTAILVRLDEGLLLTSNLEDASAPVAIGQRVEVVFEPISNEITLPRFRSAT